MNIFSKRNLSVTESELKKEYRKLSDEELMREVKNSLNIVRLPRNTKLNFIMLLIDVPFTRKQSLLFLEKFKQNNQKIAYFYRHLIRCAHFYGVPKVIIENYQKKKENYHYYKKDKWYNSDSKFLEKSKLQMYKDVNTLFSATLEMIKRSKTRKYKLEKLTEKIVDKKN